ncbi:hypothetical protein VCHA40P240_40145 [Vibrio chagasii]|nr:hypothetical protein VCHA40P240_40145 [Vibrio chagasii]
MLYHGGKFDQLIGYSQLALKNFELSSKLFISLIDKNLPMHPRLLQSNFFMLIS